MNICLAVAAAEEPEAAPKHECTVCHTVYNDALHHEPFHRLPDWWCCRGCGAMKDKVKLKT